MVLLFKNFILTLRNSYTDDRRKEVLGTAIILLPP
jgi:hypothetical protein